MKSIPFLAAAFTASSLSAQIPVAPGATLKLVADGYKFTEGPAADAKGDVYFTDQPNDRIMKWSAATGKVETFLQPCGRANGLYFDREGKLVACADEKGELQRIDTETKEVTVILKSYSDKLFNGPNDVWVDPKGAMFFTDPFYKRDYWKDREKPEQEKQRVFYLAKGAKQAQVADDSLEQPNGIIGSPDGRQLYVADIGAKKTFRYRITNDGRWKHLSNRKRRDGVRQEGRKARRNSGARIMDCQHHLRRAGDEDAFHHRHGFGLYDRDDGEGWLSCRDQGVAGTARDLPT